MNTDENMVEFFEEGSMLPTRKAALASIDLTEYPSARVLVEEAIPVAGSYPVFVYYEECRTVIEDALSATLLGQVDAETAMKQAAEEIRTILAGG
jgi:ABC-type glycerol-3-phosphate transport system substrate-binding protein